MLDLMNKITQLSEAVKEKDGGREHTAEPGGYGRKDDEDSDGKKVKSDAPKKGRGRPKKDADASGEEKKYDTKSLGSVFGGGQKPKKEIGKVSKKHSLKEYFDHLDDALNEAEQIQIKPASQIPKKPGQTSVPGQQPQVSGQQPQNTQVIQQGDKTLGTVNNPQLAQQIKQSIGKGEMTLMPGEEMEEGLGDVARKVGGVVKKVGGTVLDKLGHGSDEDLIRDMQKRAGMPQTGKLPMATSNKEVDEASYSAKAARAGKDIGKPGKQFAQIAKGAAERYGSKERGEKVAGAVLAKLRGKTNEGELPVQDGNKGAGLGAGRNAGVLEGKKPDFLDLDKDKNKDESMAQAAKDAKKKKTKVKEGMEHKLKAAHHRGKAHALGKESYNCKYDDMEESRMYHEGYKEGLDECYGQMPVQGYVGEMGQSTVDDMASYGAHTPTIADEGNAFTGKLAATPAGDKFSFGGKTYKDTSSIEEMDSVFESWDSQLGSLLTEYDTIQEGMTVSISKGQQGSPDSVSVTAQDGEADQLLQVMKQAGLGLFGGDDAGRPGQSSSMSLQPAIGGPEGGEMEIGVVDDHDGMMDLIRKVTGGAPAPAAHGFGDDEGSSDYEDEEGSEGHDHDEETCNECGSGMHEGACSPEEGAEVIDEVESEDQQEYEVAEDNAPDSGAAETTADENAEAAEDQALATVDAADEEKVDESYANSDDDTFETDIDFMTKVISGGLNKQKSTGQTTAPIIAGQKDRMGYNMNESVNQWKKLAGLLK